MDHIMSQVDPLFIKKMNLFFKKVDISNKNAIFWDK